MLIDHNYIKSTHEYYSSLHNMQKANDLFHTRVEKTYYLKCFQRMNEFWIWLITPVSYQFETLNSTDAISAHSKMSFVMNTK